MLDKSYGMMLNVPQGEPQHLQSHSSSNSPDQDIKDLGWFQIRHSARVLLRRTMNFTKFYMFHWKSRGLCSGFSPHIFGLTHILTHCLHEHEGSQKQRLQEHGQLDIYQEIQTSWAPAWPQLYISSTGVVPGVSAPSNKTSCASEIVPELHMPWRRHLREITANSTYQQLLLSTGNFPAWGPAALRQKLKGSYKAEGSLE